jgi:hypothetical protein
MRILLTVLLVVAGLSVCGNVNADEAARRPVPIEVAVRTAAVRAFQWNSRAQLLFATSQDAFSETDSDDLGLDGKRRAWAVQFKDPETIRTIFIELRDGKIHRFRHSGNIDPRPGIDVSSLNVDGKGLSAAARRFGLLPGKGWAIGYHFVFHYDFEMGHYVEVIGRNADGSRGHLLFNALSGKRFTDRAGTLRPDEGRRAA